MGTKHQLILIKNGRAEAPPPLTIPIFAFGEEKKLQFLYNSVKTKY
jgi:hypothetical protein